MANQSTKLPICVGHRYCRCRCGGLFARCACSVAQLFALRVRGFHCWRPQALGSLRFCCIPTFCSPDSAPLCSQCASPQTPAYGAKAQASVGAVLMCKHCWEWRARHSFVRACGQLSLLKIIPFIALSKTETATGCHKNASGYTTIVHWSKRGLHTWEIVIKSHWN